MTSGDAGFGVRRGLECTWRRKTGEVGSRAGRNALLPLELAMNILAVVLPAYSERVENAFEKPSIVVTWKAESSFMQKQIALVVWWKTCVR